MARDDYPLRIWGRLLACRKCAAHIDLIELPHPKTRPHQYTCGTCLQPTKTAGTFTPTKALATRKAA